MQRVLTVPLGIVMAKESVDSPWEDHIWRAEGVFLNAPQVTAWRELYRNATNVHYHVATLPLELHPKETAGYLANLEGDRPTVYVVWRRKLFSEDTPIEAALVLASAHEAEAYGQVEEERVGAVAMPEALVELMSAFIDEHHVEEKFIKRQRQRHHREEEHSFGQEPLDVLRRRIAERQANAKAASGGGEKDGE
jgi:hypothetical protein